MDLSKFTSNKNILNEIVAKLCRMWYIAENGPVIAFFFFFFFFSVSWLGLRYIVAVLYNLHIYCSWNLLLNDIRSVRGSVSSIFFFKFITEPIEIGFVIIKTDAYQLRSIFRPITVRFDRLGLIGLIWNINKKSVHIKKNIYISVQQICSHKKNCFH